MKAHEIMNRHVYKVFESDTIRSVIKKFIEHHISGLPVINDKNEIIAYISDGDIMRHIGKHKDIFVDSFYYVNVLKGDDDEFEERAKKILDLNVLNIAKKKVITVDYHEDIENIAALLGKKRIKKLPVVRNGGLAGIISRGDVIRHSFHTLL
ncbi:CBS domain-containing protein [Peribacillus sp. JNUCC 23]